MNYDAIPETLRGLNLELGKDRPSLRELGNIGLSKARPLSIGKSQRISFVGGETLKIRSPDLGETGLSTDEIKHAFYFGITC
jgi:hypothetical protein